MITTVGRTHATLRSLTVEGYDSTMLNNPSTAIWLLAKLRDVEKTMMRDVAAIDRRQRDAAERACNRAKERIRRACELATKRLTAQILKGAQERESLQAAAAAAQSDCEPSTAVDSTVDATPEPAPAGLQGTSDESSGASKSGPSTYGGRRWNGEVTTLAFRGPHLFTYWYCKVSVQPCLVWCPCMPVAMNEEERKKNHHVFFLVVFVLLVHHSNDHYHVVYHLVPPLLTSSTILLLAPQRHHSSGPTVGRSPASRAVFE